MTKREALEECIEMWEEVAETGCKKRETAVYECTGNLCACCTYDKQFDDDCSYCPLLDRWGDNNQSVCHDSQSYYSFYEEAKTINERKLPAAKIVSAAKQALEALDA